MKRFLLISLILLTVFSISELISKKYTRKSDSLELLKFYQQTDGVNWYKNTGWSDGSLPVWDWYGVGIDLVISHTDTMVVVIEIELDENNLSGTIPFLNLPDLFSMFVSKNKLFGTIPAFINMGFSWFDVSNNKFLFEDFMTNLDFLKGLDVFIYEIQDTVFSLKVTKNPTNLFVENPYKYEGCRYNWKINNKLVSLQNKDTITVTSMLAEIKCEVTNSKLPYLYLQSEPYQIKTELISPADSSKNLSNIELRWKYIDIADRYLVKTIINYTDGKITRYDTTSKTIFKYPANVANFNSSVIWSVAPIRGEEIGGYTKDWTYTTKLVREYTYPADSLELVRFYYENKGDTWSNKAFWLSNLPVWKWQGVKTVPMVINDELVHRIIRISLPYSKVPFKELDLSLPELDTLVLYSNNATFTINNDKIYLPKLRYLAINSNIFQGDVSLFNVFKNLEYLNISYCGLTTLNDLNLNNLLYLGADGNSFNNTSFNLNLPKLESLTLRYSKLSGLLSNLNLLDLKNLYVNNNEIEGFADNELPKLKFLDASNNIIENNSKLLELINIETLTVNFNKLSGTLSEFNFPKLKIFNASNNQLFGKIEINKMPNLISLDLSKNAFTDTLQVVKHDSLINLNLSSNKITDINPAIELPNLSILNLLTNNLTKFFIIKAPKLQNLTLSNNLISDTVPDFVSYYPNLKNGYLILTQNMLTYEQLIPNHLNNKQINTYLCNNQNITYKLKVKLNGSEFELEPDYNGIADKFEWIDQYNVKLSNGRIYYKNKPVNKIRCKIDYSKISDVTYYTEYLDPAPKKIYPEYDGQQVALKPEFKWSKVDYATKYWVLVSENSIMNPANIYETTDTVFQLPLNLLPNKKYYWVLRFYIDDQTASGLMSDPWPFNTIKVDINLNEKDSLALVKFYNSLNGPNWTNQLNWFSGEPAWKWGGLGFITREIDGTYTNYVSYINIPFNKLKGEIDRIELDSLTSLVLNDNEISGKFPELSSEVITQIYAKNNDFESGIVNAMKNSVSFIELSYNKFSEEIEEIVGDNLGQLNLNNNQIPGYFPSLIAPRLQTINMSFNKLDKILPVIYHDSIWNIKINDNNIVAKFPELNTPLLNSINFSNNKFYGSIPNIELDKLTELNLSNNNLTGNIPALDVINLSYLNLSKNKLSGQLPKINSFALRSIDISYNKFVFEDMGENGAFYMPLQSFTYFPQDTLLELIPSEINGNFSLTVAISQNLQNKFNWYKDGFPIEDTTQSIVITDVNAKYRCDVSYITLTKLILQTQTKSYSELTVSVDDLTKTDDFSISPNPVVDFFNLNIKSNSEMAGKIRIFDISGRLVLEAGTIEGHNIINIKKLSAGIYFVYIGNEIKPLKIIKL